MTIIFRPPIRITKQTQCDHVKQLLKDLFNYRIKKMLNHENTL